MDSKGSAGPRHSTSSREEFLAILPKLGPPLTTRVTVNGHRLMLEAAIELVERLPDDSHFARRGLQLFVEPDPFATEVGPSTGAESAARSDLTQRLIRRQDETDRLEAEEKLRGRWWRRLRRRLTGQP